jgi:hypothetical protein
MKTRRTLRTVSPTLELFERRDLLSTVHPLVHPHIQKMGHVRPPVIEIQNLVGHRGTHLAATKEALVALPDLCFNNFYLKDNNTLVLSVKNCGTKAVSNFEALLTQKHKGVSDKHSAKVTITDTILPGQVVTKTYSLVALFGRANDPGKMHYTCTLDPQNKILESNESNNFREFDA